MNGDSGVTSNGSVAKPTPPPTLPKSYTPSAAAAYRLASMERLAQRQRLFEQGGQPVEDLQQQSPVQSQPINNSGSGTSAGIAPPVPAPKPVLGTKLQNKRELFFKNDSSNGTINTGSPSPVQANVNSNTPVSNSLPHQNSFSNSMSNQSASLPPSGSMNKRIPIAKSESTDSSDSKEKPVKTEQTTVSKTSERKVKKLDGYVGFANLPNQVYRKAVKKGFEFTLMVVGRSGLGKSTLINTMFLADIYGKDHPGPSLRVGKTVRVETNRCLLKEKGVNLTLTIVDTPGFGDAVDNSDCWQPVLEYIESRYEEYLNAESRVNRKVQHDSRVHCCLYFLESNSHGMTPLDVEFMQRLHDKVNIIPVISKADTMTPNEVTEYKKQILNEIALHKIKIYDFPDSDKEEDRDSLKKLKSRVPFAVVGSTEVHEVDGKKIRGRKYPWGLVEVENLEHNDFVALRNMLLRTHLQDLKEVTSNVHYENFRFRKLACFSADGPKGMTKNPLAQMEDEKREHDAKLKKMEAEMEQVFEMKVKEKKQKLKDSEIALQQKNEQMMKRLESEASELDDRRRQLEAEIREWENSSGVSLDELRRRSLERETTDGKEKKIKKKGLF
ncbi:septin-7 isoform X2 [Daktulosphaira vitifoliae]|uniref:septin-7 isoform X2 n=1 Tax=Daktulosphaira vitifoliae TaxID=58002 RepID=UPI0021AA9B16|nr:septin-7 isoform X2 [Daktulosphaira vitifoliae]